MFHLWFCLILLDVKINLYQCQCQCQCQCHELVGSASETPEISGQFILAWHKSTIIDNTGDVNK